MYNQRKKNKAVIFGNLSYEGTSGGKTNFEAEKPMSGNDWNKYFKNKYGEENVNWKPNNLEDIIKEPKRLYGCSKEEVKSLLGEGWTEGVYGTSGDGWKFTRNDGMVFYHAGDGRHEGSYYGFSSADTGKVKIVGNDYVELPGDKATIYYFYGEGDN